MTPDHLAAVDRSWTDLRCRRAELAEHLQRSFELLCMPAAAAERARWLVDAVEALAGLLRSPSRLGTRARELAGSWPVPGTAPSFGVEGVAWMRAAGAVSAAWTSATEDAWRHAWLLLSDVLAEESLSPFACAPVSDGSGARP